MILGNCKLCLAIAFILACTILLETIARKRVFKFNKGTTIQSFSCSDNVGQPISTNSTSLIFCAIYLMQYGPSPCMEYYTSQGMCRSNNGGEIQSSLNTSMDVGWSFFNVQSTECKLDSLGRNYRGKLNTTITGIPCMIWSALSPHRPYRVYKHILSSKEGPEILKTNYCRNPDSYPGGLWCYTIDPGVRWQLCDVPSC